MITRQSTTRAIVAIALSFLAMTLCAADKGRNKTAGKALFDIGMAWEKTGLDAALQLSEAALTNFPRSSDVVFSHCLLLEVAGRTEEALRYYDDLAKKGGPKPSLMGMRVTVREACDACRYVLYARKGQLDKAYAYYTAFWDSTFSNCVASCTDDERIWMRARIDIEAACLLADGAGKTTAAARKLADAEQALRPIYRQKGMTNNSLAGEAYYHCLYEWQRLARLTANTPNPVTVPKDVLKVPELPVKEMLDAGPEFMGFYSVCVWPVTTFSIHSDICRSAFLRWSEAMLLPSHSRSLRAEGGFMVGADLIRQGQTTAALRCLTAAAQTDTWLQPLATAAVARWSSTNAPEGQLDSNEESGGTPGRR